MKKMLIFMVLLLTITGCGSKKTENSNEPITNIAQNIQEQNDKIRSKIMPNKIVDGISFENTILMIEDGATQIITNVKNTNDTDIQIENFNMIVKNIKEQVLTTIPSYIGGILAPNESKIIKSSIDISLETATSIDYELINENI